MVYPIKYKADTWQAVHPQTQGKEERFHRTLKQELLDLSSSGIMLIVKNGSMHGEKI